MRLALVFLIAACGCKKTNPGPPPPPDVTEVRVVDKTPEEARDRPPLDEAALTARAADAIAQSSGLHVSDAGAAGARHYRLRVEVRTEGAQHQGKQLYRALVTAKMTPIGEGPEQLSFEQTAVAERVADVAPAKKPADAGASAADDPWRAHVQHAVEDVVKGVGARVKLSTAKPDELAFTLEGPDADLREEAARLCGEHKANACVPGLIKLLKGDDRDGRDRAIGALAEIGDRRAVRPLTEVARFRDLGDLPKVLDALAMIGGDEARSYLEFVASGHDSSEIRDLAKQALGHLEHRATLDAGVKR
jgi:hypothetical protein